MQQNSVNAFNQLLCATVCTQEFKFQLNIILENDPYYIPAYLEHLWLAERDHDNVLCQNLLRDARRALERILTDGKIRSQLNEFWTDYEIVMCEKLLHILMAREKSFFKRVMLKSKLSVLRSLFALKTNTTPTTNHMRKVDGINVADLQSEILSAKEYWWNIDTVRGHTIAHHKYTHSIIIRNRTNQVVEYIPHDGVHESETTPLTPRFPKTHDAVMEFANKNNLAVGRVAIVRLQPYKQSYRHYDPEEYLQGRHRYHLVIQASNNNLLSSGNEHVIARNGEIWFFDNVAMHRAENDSPTPRYHVIFDGYPLNKKK